MAFLLGPDASNIHGTVLFADGGSDALFRPDHVLTTRELERTMPDDTPEAPHLLFERDGHVAIVTLNRPEASNAFSAEMLVRMYDAWIEIDENPDIRVGILTGAGGNFCSGMPTSRRWRPAIPTTSAASASTRTPTCTGRRCCATSSPGKPIIAAVEGYAVAGGTEILQATDIRVAGRDARTFGIAEVRRGLFPLGGSTVRLPPPDPLHDRGRAAAHRPPDPAPQEAKEIGLIGHVVPDGQALDKAREIADQIAAERPARGAGRARSPCARPRELTEKDGPGPRARARLAGVRHATTPRRARRPSPRSARPNFTGT